VNAAHPKNPAREPITEPEPLEPEDDVEFSVTFSDDFNLNFLSICICRS